MDTMTAGPTAAGHAQARARPGPKGAAPVGLTPGRSASRRSAVMTALPGTPAPAAGTGGSAAVGACLPGERGATSVDDQVVAKIASQAALEAVGPVPEAGRPRTSVTVRRRRARIRVAVELPYPTGIGAACAAVRRRVAERVTELTGTPVDEVVVRVERLHPAHPPGAAPRRIR
jgi:uncharacterized alkaline shock family protein YloU